MTTTDEAADIRAQYKARGWGSRQISVRSEYFSMGSSINVRIKDGAIPLPVAKEIAEGKEHIHRCEITGEILGGGNRYVHISLTPEAETAKAQPYLRAVEDAIAYLKGKGESTLAPVAGTIYSVGRSRAGGVYALWGETAHIRSYMNTAEQVAIELALAEERRVYELRT